MASLIQWIKSVFVKEKKDIRIERCRIKEIGYNPIRNSCVIALTNGKTLKVAESDSLRQEDISYFITHDGTKFIVVEY